jgi:lipoprotein-anchoring transpeptidase ErfK/SrfK
MQRILVSAVLAAIFAASPALAQTGSPGRSNLGGGFIEYLFGDRPAAPPRYQMAPAASAAPQTGYAPPQRQAVYAPPQPVYAQPQPQAPVYLQPQSQPGPLYAPRPMPNYIAPPPMMRASLTPPAQPVPAAMDPKFLKQEVEYSGPEKPGTIVINTPERMLYLVEENGKALRYGIGVGRPGFEWAGEHTVTAKREWPDWYPPKEMIERQPYLPRRMAGGPDNPLGARAMYLGSTLYRIHGSNEPWTIGHAVSSGCIRMRNEDVIDLYGHVEVGAKVIVI